MNFPSRCSEEKLKIGITCYPTVGGSGVIATELGKLLAERGHEIHFITSSVPFRLNKAYPNIFFHQVEVSAYSVFQYPPYDLALAGKMAEIAELVKLDVLHVHYAIPHAVCAHLAQSMSRHPFKIVTTLHGTDITVLGMDASLKNLIRFGIEKSDAVTAVSQSLADDTKQLISPNKNIHVVYNFIDERVYNTTEHCAKKEDYCISEEDKVIVHLSNFRQVKRVNDVVDAFHRVHGKMNAKLLLIGDGPEVGRIRKQVEKLGLQEKVYFLGKQENVADILRSSDVMLLLSEKESFGLVLLEAMACGVACIGSNAGGIPEVIVHEETGYVGDVGDVETISTYLLELVQNDEKRRVFAQNGMERTRTEFHSTNIVAQYEALYYSLMDDERWL